MRIVRTRWPAEHVKLDETVSYADLMRARPPEFRAAGATGFNHIDLLNVSFDQLT